MCEEWKRGERYDGEMERQDEEKWEEGKRGDLPTVPFIFVVDNG